MYQLNDRVVIQYREFDLVTSEFLGWTREFGKVTRIWTRGNNITIRTDSGKTFVRDAQSKDVVKQTS